MKGSISLGFLLVFGNIFGLTIAQSENEFIAMYFNDLKESGYNPKIPPQGNGGNGAPVEVLTTMYFLDIHKIDDFNMEYRASFYFRQSWNDSRLAYANRDISIITFSDTEYIWLPDLFFVEEKEGITHDIIRSNVFIKIFPNGEVKYSTRVSVTFSCPMDFSNYPHDIHRCPFSIESYGSTKDRLFINWDNRTGNFIGKTDQINVLSFELTDVETTEDEVSFSSGTYRRLAVTLTFKRKFGFFLTRLYIPFIFFVVLSWISFFIKPEMITLRLGLLLVVLYLMVNIGSDVNNYIPPAPYTKASDVWIAVCESLVFATFLEFILVTVLTKTEKKFEKVRHASDPEVPIIGKEKSNNLQSIASSRMVAGLLSRSSKLPKLVDNISCVLFPLLFIIFNLIYWLIY